jgi:hypothetical protein
VTWLKDKTTTRTKINSGDMLQNYIHFDGLIKNVGGRKMQS